MIYYLFNIYKNIVSHNIVGMINLIDDKSNSHKTSISNAR